MKLYVDIGDIYTKFAVVREGDSVEYGSFASFAAPYPPPGDFTDFEERVYFAGDGDAKKYLIGWPGALTEETQPLGSDHDEEKLQAVLNKVVFENAEKGSEIELYLAYDFGEKAESIRKLAERIEGPATVRAQHLYSDKVEKKDVRIACRAVPGPLALFDRYRAHKSGKDGDSAVIIDIGFTRTKIFSVSSELGVERHVIADAGGKTFLEALLAFLRQEGRDVNMYSVMKELELFFPRLNVGQEEFDAEHVFRNVAWDLNKGIVAAVSRLLKEHYNKTGRWLDTLAVTGGGACWSGELLRASLKKEKFTFDNITVDKAPRYAVVNGTHSMREETLWQK